MVLVLFLPGPKPIEVAPPLAAISRVAAREKSIRHGHPLTLHLWWARRPLTATRAVLWASLIDDPSGDETLTAEQADAERRRLFGILERLVVWENTNHASVIGEARAERLNGPSALLDRGAFPRPGAHCLVAVFTSEACSGCARVWESTHRVGGPRRGHAADRG